MANAETIQRARQAPETPEPFERVMDGRLIASVLATGLLTFSGVVVETAMNVTFPTLMEEFGVGTATVQWLTTGYLLVIACVIAASSFLKRSVKIATLHRVAVALLFVGVIMSAAAPNFALLLAGRLLQGVGLGIALPLMFNIILEQAPLSQMGLLVGIGNLITGAAPAVGPFFGGLVVEALGWRWIFLMLLPLLLVSLVCGAYGIRQASPLEQVRFQTLDYLLLVGCFVCLVLGVNQAADAGWTSVNVLGLLGAAIVLGVAFVLRSARAQEPLIRIQTFRVPGFACSVVVILLTQLITLGLGYLIPNYAQLALGEGSFIAGCLLLPGCILGAVAAPLSGGLADRVGFAKPIMAGNLCMVGGLALLAIFGVQLGNVLLVTAYALYAAGMGCTVGNSMTNGLNQLPEDIKTDGNACINTLQQLAGAIGTAVATTIVAAAQATTADVAAGTTVGVQQAFAVFTVLAVALFAVSLAALRLTRKQALSAE